jgi:hypothetical protein
VYLVVILVQLLPNDPIEKLKLAKQMRMQ